MQRRSWSVIDHGPALTETATHHMAYETVIPCHQPPSRVPDHEAVPLPFKQGISAATWM